MARKLWIPTCTDTLTKSSKSFWIVIVPLLNLEERLSMSGFSSLLLISPPAKLWKIVKNRVNFTHIISLFFISLVYVNKKEYKMKLCIAQTKICLYVNNSQESCAFKFKLIYCIYWWSTKIELWRFKAAWPEVSKMAVYKFNAHMIGHITPC